MKRNVKTIAITTMLLAAATLTGADKVTFEDDILPINCFLFIFGLRKKK